MTPHNFRNAAKKVLQIEADTILEQIANLDKNFEAACQTILETKGHTIVTGMGKSGHIGAKIAATLASTGTPAFFVHPAEAGHGDLGMITPNDTLLAMSYSGESHEIMTMIPLVQALGVTVIAITARPESSIAKAANISLHLTVEKEACPIGLAPTSSSTATLALGDAIAIAVMDARRFTPTDFARSHPFGRLGRRLLTTVKDVMRTGDELPLNYPEDTVQTALFEITAKRLGLTLIIDCNMYLIGIYTDGDLRRSLEKYPDTAMKMKLSEVMTHSPLYISPQTLAAEALKMMQEKGITALPVIENDKLWGIVHIHDLLAAGVA